MSKKISDLQNITGYIYSKSIPILEKRYYNRLESNDLKKCHRRGDVDWEVSESTWSRIS